MEDKRKVVNLEATGVVSGDYESNCLDVTKEEFKRLTGFDPIEYDESYFYKNLFRYYDIKVPIKYITDFNKTDILKIKVTYEIEKVGEAEER